MSDILCNLEHVNVSLPASPAWKQILHDICWQVHRHEHTVLIGRNGAGKSTLLKLIHGELWSAAGTVTWHTRDGSETSRIAGLAETAIVSPQQQELFQKQGWDISGLELLLTGFEGTPMLYAPCDREKERIAVKTACELQAESLLKRSIRTMSQGQLRLLLLGRALVREPMLVLLDECTDGLDERHRDLFYAVLERAAKNCTFIMATHRESRIPEWCQHRRYISNGELTEAPTEALSFSTRTQPHLAERPVTPCGAPLITVSNATVYLEGTPVLKGLNWKLFPQERWLLEGANGSGKSTFLRLLAGDEQVAWPGKIQFNLPGDKDNAIPLSTIRRRIRLISDLSQAFYSFDVTALELVLSGIDNTVGLYRNFSEEETQEAHSQLDAVCMSHFADTPISRLSSGQLRRLFLARALVGNPLLLLMDEPCSGLDCESRDAYLNALDALADSGMQFIFVSHYQEDTPASVNRVACMRNGQLKILR